LNPRQAAFIGMLAAIYAVTTVMLGELGYSWIQVRLSEALTSLPYLFGVYAVAGLTLGVLIVNRRIVACIYPVVVNALGVSAYVARFYGVPYFASVFSIGIGEFISAVIVGYPLLRALEKSRLSILLRRKKSGNEP